MSVCEWRPPLLIDKWVAKEERVGVGCVWERNLGRVCVAVWWYWWWVCVIEGVWWVWMDEWGYLGEEVLGGWAGGGWSGWEV